MSSSLRSMQEHVKALTTIVTEQAKTIIELNTRLSRLTNSASTNGQHIDSTPASGPPATVENDDTKQRTSAKRRSLARTKKPQWKDDADPDYMPPITISDSSDHEAFKRKGKKKRPTPQASKNPMTTSTRISRI